MQASKITIGNIQSAVFNRRYLASAAIAVGSAFLAVQQGETAPPGLGTGRNNVMMSSPQFMRNQRSAPPNRMRFNQFYSRNYFQGFPNRAYNPYGMFYGYNPYLGGYGGGSTNYGENEGSGDSSTLGAEYSYSARNTIQSNTGKKLRLRTFPNGPFIEITEEEDNQRLTEQARAAEAAKDARKSEYDPDHSLYDWRNSPKQPVEQKKSLEQIRAHENQEAFASAQSQKNGSGDSARLSAAQAKPNSAQSTWDLYRAYKKAYDRYHELTRTNSANPAELFQALEQLSKLEKAYAHAYVEEWAKRHLDRASKYEK